MYAQRELASYEMEIQLKESERDAQLQKERIWRRSQMQQRLIHTLYIHTYILEYIHTYIVEYTRKYNVTIAMY